ncbi:hypothetical protein [Streptomyces sp. NPDC005423]|uniref:ABC transporter substrate-binding protein n=1 Tax=Streptomyces sp. NPDC005423 TaxID=3155343 RepID=UPI0033B79EC6
MSDADPRQSRPLHPSVRWKVAHPVQFRFAVSAFVLAVLVALSGITYVLWPRPPVLITDGGKPPTDNLRRISGLIEEENAWVKDQHVAWVSLALMMPMDPAGGTVSADSIRHTVEGVYLAQRWANRHTEGKLSPPLVRVLLVDDGKVGTKWKEAVNQIRDKVSSEHIAAVVGLGVSIDTTRWAIEALGKQRIAMVGSSISADDLKNMRAMVRVVPPNKDQVTAVLGELPKRTSVPPVLVQDTNPADAYAKDLGTDFAAKFPPSGSRGKSLTDSQLSFDSSLPASNQVLNGLAQQVCSSSSNTVLFAGRGRDLPAFLSPLATYSGCQDRDVTVLTGDDAEQVARPLPPNAPMWNATAAPRLHVYYAASAYPDAWSDASYYNKAVTDRFGATDKDGFRSIFPGEQLGDGAAIMAHDGALAVITAVSDLVGTSGSGAGKQASDGDDSLLEPPASAVANQLPSVKFAGASGWIAFDGNHDPVDKAIPILELHSTGRVDFIRVTSGDKQPANR